jgi:hypothetical protein
MRVAAEFERRADLIFTDTHWGKSAHSNKRVTRIGIAPGKQP